MLWRKERIALPTEKLIARYRAGESTRELGADCEDDDHKWHAALHIMLADVGRIDPAATASGGNWWHMLAESLMI